MQALGVATERQNFRAIQGRCDNIIAEIPGAKSPGQIAIFGAHYDTLDTTPGANDNASGCAALIELARHVVASGQPPERTLRFVFFACEEPPSFQGFMMGSVVYAQKCKRDGDDIRAMVSLETLAYYTDEGGSQEYPPPLSLYFPSAGNFLAFVSDRDNKPLLDKAIGAFRKVASLPSEAAALPAHIPGVGWSDHWSFWQQGYPGIMVTDTAPYRYPQYHQPDDKPENLDFPRFTLAVEGLRAVVDTLAAADSR
ncbi:MAG: M20/M25/M40 family metallo-hydrolase [Verrucomicrobiales bacterium]